MAERQSRAEIAAVILSKIADGHLPSIEITRVWAGRGSGRPCDGCDQPVTAADVEHEIDLAGAVTLHLHSGCFMIWQDALEKRKISGGSGASPWTLFFDIGIARRAARPRHHQRPLDAWHGWPRVADTHPFTRVRAAVTNAGDRLYGLCDSRERSGRPASRLRRLHHQARRPARRRAPHSATRSAGLELLAGGSSAAGG